MSHDLIPVPVPVGSAEIPGLQAAMDGSGPALLLVPPGSEGARLVGALGPAAATGVPKGTAVVIATSGSTGTPKGVRISAKALRHSARATHAHLGGPGQWLLAMSAARIAGLQVVLRSRAAGETPVVLETTGGFRPDAFAAALATMTGERRYVSLVPTQLIRLLDADVDLTSLDAILLGGGPIPGGLVERAATVGANVVRTYGMTETCGGCVYDGRPLDRVGVRITDDGLVAITGPVLARGYLGGPDFGGEFVSSDLGRLDDDGVLTVLGRADDVILSGGVNVPAQSVEQVLAGHPGVAEVVVVGRPDPEWGEAVVAVVVPSGPVPLAELRDLAAGALDKAWAPRDVVTVDRFPSLPSGKVDRDALRALVRGTD
ncbi:o-succinylbenzoate--CoA ligase [Sporichthya polymorpha]|uniref:o-succinylbenzoate--CoA ligase n=1 Tax=Sporichthya polymorpha TaxID=35751 RepID=UPI0003A236DD|nr:o-succinylbenzoate--CoA ligase [Sporichthya polymorpha]